MRPCHAPNTPSGTSNSHPHCLWRHAVHTLTVTLAHGQHPRHGLCGGSHERIGILLWQRGVYWVALYGAVLCGRCVVCVVRMVRLVGFPYPFVALRVTAWRAGSVACWGVRACVCARTTVCAQLSPPRALSTMARRLTFALKARGPTPFLTVRLRPPPGLLLSFTRPLAPGTKYVGGFKQGEPRTALRSAPRSVPRSSQLPLGHLRRLPRQG